MKSALTVAVFATVLIASAFGIAVEAPVAGGWLGANSAIFSVINPILNFEVASALNNVTLPPITKKGLIDITISNIHLSDVACTDCVNLAFGNGYVQFTTTNATAKIASDFSAKAGLIHSHGSCLVDVGGLSASAQTTFGTPTAAGKPTIVVNGMQVTLGTLSLHCTGLAGHILDGLDDLFRNQIKDLVAKESAKIIPQFVEKKVNAILANVTLEQKLLNGYAVANFNLVPSASYISTSGVHLGVVAAIVPAANPNMIFPFPAPTSLSNKCGAGMVNTGISAYTFNTAMYTLFQSGAMHVTLENFFNASQVAMAVPGFAQQLGPDAKVSATVAANASGTLVFSNQTVSVTLPIKFILTGANNTRFELALKAFVDLSMQAQGGTIPTVSSKINDLTLEDGVVEFTNVGGSMVPFLMKWVDGMIAKNIVPNINEFLAVGLPLPSVDIFDVENINIVMNDGDACIGADLKLAF